MVTLTRRFTWKKWAPDLGENRELPEPVLFLELATGITADQLREIGEGLSKARAVFYVPPEIPEGATADEVTALFTGARDTFLSQLRAIFGAALAPYVRVHAGPHTVDGQPLATLDDYLKLVEQSADLGVNARLDLEQALVRFNSIEGHDELFSPRSSGGARSMDARRTAKAAKKTASP